MASLVRPRRLEQAGLEGGTLGQQVGLCRRRPPSPGDSSCPATPRSSARQPVGCGTADTATARRASGSTGAWPAAARSPRRRDNPWSPTALRSAASNPGQPARCWHLCARRIGKPRWFAAATRSRAATRQAPFAPSAARADASPRAASRQRGEAGNSLTSFAKASLAAR